MAATAAAAAVWRGRADLLAGILFRKVRRHQVIDEAATSLGPAEPLY
jgi:hypothetical protein